MKLTHSPDLSKLRPAAYQRRDGKALGALWKTIEKLKSQGVDVGDAAELELLERQKIKEKYPKKKMTVIVD